jgi:hypothetical protein
MEEFYMDRDMEKGRLRRELKRKIISDEAEKIREEVRKNRERRWGDPKRGLRELYMKAKDLRYPEEKI